MNDKPVNENDKEIDIFVFTNGQENSPPRKFHLNREALFWWDATLEFLAISLYGYLNSGIVLWTVEGKKVSSSRELKNGAAYVAAVPEDPFIDTGYDKYLIKASRSWEKSLSRRSNQQGQLNMQSDPTNSRVPKELHLLPPTTKAPRSLLVCEDRTKQKNQQDNTKVPIIKKKVDIRKTSGQVSQQKYNSMIKESQSNANSVVSPVFKRSSKPPSTSKIPTRKTLPSVAFGSRIKTTVRQKMVEEKRQMVQDKRQMVEDKRVSMPDTNTVTDTSNSLSHKIVIDESNQLNTTFSTNTNKEFTNDNSQYEDNTNMFLTNVIQEKDTVVDCARPQPPSLFENTLVNRPLKNIAETDVIYENSQITTVDSSTSNNNTFTNHDRPYANNPILSSDILQYKDILLFSCMNTTIRGDTFVDIGIVTESVQTKDASLHTSLVAIDERPPSQHATTETGLELFITPEVLAPFGKKEAIDTYDLLSQNKSWESIINERFPFINICSNDQHLMFSKCVCAEASFQPDPIILNPEVRTCYILLPLACSGQPGRECKCEDRETLKTPPPPLPSRCSFLSESQSIKMTTQGTSSKRASCESQTEHAVESDSPLYRIQLCEQCSQTDWCNILLLARLQDDGHYTFHFPTIQTIKRMNLI